MKRSRKLVLTTLMAAGGVLMMLEQPLARSLADVKQAGSAPVTADQLEALSRLAGRLAHSREGPPV